MTHRLRVRRGAIESIEYHNSQQTPEQLCSESRESRRSILEKSAESRAEYGGISSHGASLSFLGLFLIELRDDLFYGRVLHEKIMHSVV